MIDREHRTAAGAAGGIAGAQPEPPLLRTSAGAGGPELAIMRRGSMRWHLGTTRSRVGRMLRDLLRGEGVVIGRELRADDDAAHVY